MLLWLKRGSFTAVAVPLAYFFATLVGLLPANRGFRPTAEGISIFVLSNDVHTDIIVPRTSDVADWYSFIPADGFLQPEPTSSHLQFGWGDRTFYIETPTWADVRASNTVKAMFWPTATVMHVEMVDQPLEWSHCRKIELSSGQYARLVQALRDSFRRRADDSLIPIPGVAYHSRDAFYEAEGTYHLLHTCNCWTGRVLRAADVRCGIWTPFTSSVMWTLPTSEPTGADGQQP